MIEMLEHRQQIKAEILTVVLVTMFTSGFLMGALLVINFR